MLLSPVIYFSDSSSGIGALGINGQAFIIQLITFLLVFWVLKRYAFKPILRVLSERRALIESGVKLGEEMQTEKAVLEKKITEELHKARMEADQIISSAQQESRQLIQESEETAQSKAKLVVNEANEKIKQDTQRARKNLEKDLVGLITEATEAIIGEKIDPKKDAVLIDRALKRRSYESIS